MYVASKRLPFLAKGFCGLLQMQSKCFYLHIFGHLDGTDTSLEHTGTSSAVREMHLEHPAKIIGVGPSGKRRMNIEKWQLLGPALAKL